jgi:hypothetical protein
MDEVNVDPVNLGHELRQGVQLRLDLAPVVIGFPIARELLQHRQLHTLRPVSDKLLAGPARRGNPATQLSTLLVRNVDGKGANLSGGFDSASHDDLRCWSGGFEKDNDKKWVDSARN